MVYVWRWRAGAWLAARSGTAAPDPKPQTQRSLDELNRLLRCTVLLLGIVYLTKGGGREDSSGRWCCWGCFVRATGQRQRLGGGRQYATGDARRGLPAGRPRFSCVSASANA